MIVTNGVNTYKVSKTQAEAFLNNGWKEVVVAETAAPIPAVEEVKEAKATKPRKTTAKVKK